MTRDTSVTLEVRLCNVRITGAPEHIEELPEELGDVLFKFGNFKRIVASDAIRDAANPSVWSFSLDSAFLMESRNKAFIQNQIFRVAVKRSTKENLAQGKKAAAATTAAAVNNDEDDVYSNIVTSMSLFDLALAPMFHRMDLHFLPAHNFKLEYTVEVKQQCEMQLRIKEMTLNLLNPIDCFLVYGLNERNARSYHTHTIRGEVNPSFILQQSGSNGRIDMPSTLPHLLQRSIKIELIVIAPNQQQFNYGEFILPIFQFLAFASMSDSDIRSSDVSRTVRVPFNGDLMMQKQSVCHIQGLFEIVNVPRLAQVQNAILTNYGIIGEHVHPLIPGVMAPLDIPMFRSEQEAFEFQRGKSAASTVVQGTAIAPSISQLNLSDKDNEEVKNVVLRLDESTPDTLRFSHDRLTVENVGESEGLVSSTQAIRPITAMQNKYFEVRVESSGTMNDICIGLAPRGFPFNMQPGMDSHSFGYKSTNGRKYHADEDACVTRGSIAAPMTDHPILPGGLQPPMSTGSNFIHRGSYFGPGYTVGDVIGCGINHQNGALYFTKNGSLVGYAFYPVANLDSLYPTISLNCRGSKVRCNFTSSADHLFDVKQSDLPEGWSIGADKFNKNRPFFYKRSGDRTEISFAGPQTNGTSWQQQQRKHLLSHERLLMALSRPLKLSDRKKSDQKSKRWDGIKNERVLHALRAIPRPYFIPKKLISNASSGESIRAEHNGSKVDIPATWICARVLEVLDLQPGSRFLNIASGTAYMTALAAYIVNSGDCSKSGESIGIEIDANLIKMARKFMCRFSRHSGIALDNASIQKRNVLLLDGENSPYSFTLPNSDRYDAIFCQLNINRKQIPTFRSLLSSKRAISKVVVGIDNDLYLLQFKADGTCTERLLMHGVNFPECGSPSEKQLRAEQRQLMKEFLARQYNDNYTPNELIDEALDTLNRLEQLQKQWLQQQQRLQQVTSTTVSASRSQPTSPLPTSAPQTPFKITQKPLSVKIVEFLHVYHRINGPNMLENLHLQLPQADHHHHTPEEQQRRLRPVSVEEIVEALGSCDFNRDAALAYLVSVRNMYVTFRDLPGLTEKRVKELLSVNGFVTSATIQMLNDIRWIYQNIQEKNAASSSKAHRQRTHDHDSNVLLVRDIVRQYHFLYHKDKQATLAAFLK